MYLVKRCQPERSNFVALPTELSAVQPLETEGDREPLFAAWLLTSPRLIPEHPSVSPFPAPSALCSHTQLLMVAIGQLCFTDG